MDGQGMQMVRSWSRRAGYAAFYLLFFLFWFLFKMGGLPDIKHAILSTLVDVSLSVGVLLFSVEYLLPRFAYANRFGTFFSLYFAMIFLAGSAIIMSQMALSGLSILKYREYLDRYKAHYFYWFWSDLVLGSYFMLFFVSATGMAVRLAFDRTRAQTRLEKLEKEKLGSELERLKQRLNPHFLFNALNTIYYKIDRSNPGGRETLQRFSEMLRYQLYECDTEWVEIEKEAHFIHSYVEWQKDRLNPNYKVECIGFGDIEGFRISPFLLMPIVENCFKHVSHYPDAENSIWIGCGMQNDVFWMRTCNTVSPEQEYTMGGIGLESVRRRLGLIYPDRHELLEKGSPGHFEVTLKLNC